MKNPKVIVERLAAIVATFILWQTLYFKFTAHPDSVMLFTQLGAEPAGRVGLGIIELVAGALLLWKRFAFFGAVITMGLMLGAVLSHVLVLGIDFNHDGGALFALACTALVMSFIVVALNFRGWTLKSYV